VLICDVLMPGMLGTDLCRTLRAQSDLPIILLTAKRELPEPEAPLPH
jgi:CheY-like chemotaxis protein